MSDSPPVKIRRLNNAKTFCLDRVIGEYDFMSQLPDDCLVEIFARLNHADLDSLAPVSQRIRVAAVRSRPYIKAIVIEELRIIRNDIRTYSLKLCYSLQWITATRFRIPNITHTNCQYCNNLLRTYRNDASIPMLHSLFESIRSLSKKYTFNTVKLESVQFDAVFFIFCEEFLDVPCKRRVFSNVLLEQNRFETAAILPLELDGRSRQLNVTSIINSFGAYPRRFSILELHNWMVQGCSEEFDLSSTDLGPFSADYLLRWFAKNVNNPSGKLESSSNQAQINSRLNVMNLADFANFVNFRANYFVFATSNFFSAIVSRYQRHDPGVWYIQISKDLKLSNLKSGYSGLVARESTPGSFVIQKNGQIVITINKLNPHICPNSQQVVFGVHVVFH